MATNLSICIHVSISTYLVHDTHDTNFSIYYRVKISTYLIHGTYDTNCSLHYCFKISTYLVHDTYDTNFSLHYRVKISTYLVHDTHDTNFSIHYRVKISTYLIHGTYDTNFSIYNRVKISTYLVHDTYATKPFYLLPCQEVLLTLYMTPTPQNLSIYYRVKSFYSPCTRHLRHKTFLFITVSRGSTYLVHDTYDTKPYYLLPCPELLLTSYTAQTAQN